MTINKAINIGLQRTKLEFSIDTFYHYKVHAKHFLKWTTNNGLVLVNELTEHELIEYIVFMKKTCSNRTLNIRIGNLKRLFIRAKVCTDIFKDIAKFKENKKTFQMLDEKDIRRIRKYAYSLDSNILNNLMHQAVILLLMETGVRRKELCMIEKENVNLERKEILLKFTKTKSDRVVYFKERTVPILKLLLAEKSNHKYLLHNRLSNRAINTDDVTYIISKKLKRELKIDKIHPHMFRHSFGTMLVDYGVQLNIVKELMGHENIETTERYLHTNNKKKKTAYDKFILD